MKCATMLSDKPEAWGSTYSIERGQPRKVKSNTSPQKNLPGNIRPFGGWGLTTVAPATLDASAAVKFRTRRTDSGSQNTHMRRPAQDLLGHTFANSFDCHR